MRFQHVAQQIAGLKESIDHFGAQTEFLLANAVKQIFQNVRGFREIGETKGPGTSLDGMRRAEYGVELFRIRVADIKIEQQSFHRRQVLRRFLEEHLIELTHVDSHATPRARPPESGSRIWNANDPR